LLCIPFIITGLLLNNAIIVAIIIADEIEGYL
jgi:hypothetical protein